MFSCEFCKISKNTFFTEHLRTTASVLKKHVMVVFISTIFSCNFLNFLLFESKSLVHVISLAFYELIINQISSRSQLFFKIGVFKIFCNNCRKTPLLESLFNKRLQHRCFPVNIAKLLRTAFSM